MSANDPVETQTPVFTEEEVHMVAGFLMHCWSDSAATDEDFLAMAKDVEEAVQAVLSRPQQESKGEATMLDFARRLHRHGSLFEREAAQYLVAGRRYRFDDSVRRFTATFERVDHGVTLDPPADEHPVSVYYFTDHVPYATHMSMRFEEAERGG